MRMHRLLVPTLLALLGGVAVVEAAHSRDLRSEPVFWLTTPESQPSAIFRTREWQARDVFSRHAVRERKPVLGPAVPFRGSMPDPFTTAFFAQEGRQHDPWFPEGPEHFAPVQRGPTPVHEPSIFASAMLGVGLLVLGVAGRLALAVSAFLLERKAAAAKPS